MTSDHSYVLVTGANIGLGFGICCRLIDEFLYTRPAKSELTIVFTTRSTKKGSETLKSLQSHLAKHSSSISKVHFRPENVELTNLLSVKSLARKLNSDDGIPKLDSIILNAGIGGNTGINFPLAFWQILTENVAAVTWPRFKLSAVGTVTEQQLPSSDVSEPPLGQVFCANVFGHYMLCHWLMPLLRSGEVSKPSRVIWISSIETRGQHFNPDDLQGFLAEAAYEHSKRLTELLALTATDQPATRSSVRDFVAVPDGDSNVQLAPAPEMLTAHPGIVATAIIPLPAVLTASWVATAYVMRWIGSPWHTNKAYSGAASATWLALADGDEINDRQNSGRVKWGSAVDRLGHVRIEKTDVDGWGVDGSGRPVKEDWWGGRWGRTMGAIDATKNDVDAFVEQGAKVWHEMEQLRIDWEARVEKHEKNKNRQR